METVDKMYYDCLENNYPFICAPVGLLRPVSIIMYKYLDYFNFTVDLLFSYVLLQES